MRQFCNRSTCDLLQMSSSSSTTSSSLSMVFPTPPQNDPSSSVVDCTLSLGTPSTRQSGNDMMFKKSETNSSFLCWAPFHTKKTTSATAGRGCASNSTVAIVNGDPLLARRCANCGTTSTPLWRNGPRGPKSLCNACGIRYKKEERRATATGTTAPTTIHEPQQHHHHAWTHQGSHSQFRFLESDQVNGAPLFTWHVTDRTSLVHD